MWRAYLHCRSQNRARGRRTRRPLANGRLVLERLEPRALLSANWTSAPNLPFAVADAAATGADGRIYEFGGFGTAAANVFDPSANVWTSAASMPVDRYGASAATGSDGRMYVFGGIAGGQLTNTVEAYSPGSNTWSSAANMPAASFDGAAVAAKNGLIYVFGGSTSARSTEAYNPTTNAWATLAAMPTPRIQFAAAEGSDGRIYAFGGGTSNASEVNTVEVYDPASNAWSTAAAMPTARQNPGAALAADGRIYVIGGETGNDPHNAVLSTVEAYDPASNAWSSAPGLPNSCYAAAVTSGADGRVYVIGGVGGGKSSLSAVQVLQTAPRHTGIVQASGATITATEGMAFNGTVASFTDSDADSTGNFAVRVSWGDGATSTGTVGAASGGGFTVNASHTYTEEAPHQAINVTITDSDGTAATATGAASVVDAALAATPATVSTTAGGSFSGTVATFTDANPAATAGDYTAAIYWGDGASSPGVIVAPASANAGAASPGAGSSGDVYQQLAQTNAQIEAANYAAEENQSARAAGAASPGVSFVVTGTHTYSAAGQGLPVTVTITDNGGATAVATSSADIAAAPATGSAPAAPAAPATQTAPTLSDVGVGAAPAPLTPTLSLSGTPNERYVEAVYQALLGRPADDGGVAYWAGQLDRGARLGAVAAQLTHSREYFGKMIITPTYEKYLGRAPDDTGLSYWTGQMQNGLTDEQLEAGFIASDEFFSRSGGSDTAFVDAMYQQLFGRPADPSGEAYWVSQLRQYASVGAGTNRATGAYLASQPNGGSANTGTSGSNRATGAYLAAPAGDARTAVADGLAASDERERQRIIDDYMRFLGRQPDVGGLDYWVAQFTLHATNERIIAGFMATVEYFYEQTGTDPSPGEAGGVPGDTSGPTPAPAAPTPAVPTPVIPTPIAPTAPISKPTPPSVSQSPFIGAYTGSYIGTGSSQGFIATLSGAVALSVADDGAITVTVPGGGQGAVAENGQANFASAGGSGSAQGANFTFKGTFVRAADGSVSVNNGTWEAVTSLGGGGTGSGTWTASMPATTS